MNRDAMELLGAQLLELDLSGSVMNKITDQGLLSVVKHCQATQT